MQLVLGGEDSLVAQGQRIADEVCALVGAEDNPVWRILAGVHQLALVVVYVHLHLARGLRASIRPS